MDPLTKKELNGLKGDIKAKNTAIDAFKTSFEQQLKNSLGAEIDETLSKPVVYQTQERKKKQNWLHRIINILVAKYTKNP